jgi:flagellin-like hook-associated protein FlgL
MRVAQKSQYETTRYQLERITEDLTDANLTVSTGKRINDLKDDPVGVTKVLSLKSNLSNLDQLKRNTATGKTWLNAGEAALGSVQDIITDSKTIAIAMNSATANSDMRKVSAEEIRGYILTIEGLANTRVQGQYIFGGTKTDTIPFSLDDRQNPTTATYSGNSTPFAVKSGKDTTIEVGRDGDPLFSNLLNSLMSLYSDLKANNINGIGNGIDNLDIDFDTVNNAMADIGAKGVRIETKEKIITDLKLTYSDNRAEIEEADIVEAISRLKAVELAYQAALTSSSKLMKLSLADFL